MLSAVFCAVYGTLVSAVKDTDGSSMNKYNPSQILLFTAVALNKYDPGQILLFTAVALNSHTLVLYEVSALTITLAWQVRMKGVKVCTHVAGSTEFKQFGK